MNTTACNYRGCKNVAQYKCSKCEMANYCGQPCQSSDWRRHNLVCELMRGGDTEIIPPMKAEQQGDADNMTLMMNPTSGRKKQ
jgi:hypothetical protein